MSDKEPVIHSRIRLRGCDAETEFVIECTKEQYEFLETIAKKSQETSTYGCMPDMWIYETKPCIHTEGGWCNEDGCACESCWYNR